MSRACVLKFIMHVACVKFERTQIFGSYLGNSILAPCDNLFSYIQCEKCGKNLAVPHTSLHYPLVFFKILAFLCN